MSHSKDQRLLRGRQAIFCPSGGGGLSSFETSGRTWLSRSLPRFGLWLYPFQICRVSFSCVTPKKHFFLLFKRCLPVDVQHAEYVPTESEAVERPVGRGAGSAPAGSSPTTRPASQLPPGRGAPNLRNSTPRNRSGPPVPLAASRFFAVHWVDRSCLMEIRHLQKVSSTSKGVDRKLWEGLEPPGFHFPGFIFFLPCTGPTILWSEPQAPI